MEGRRASKARHRPNGWAIQAPLGRRDNVGSQAEHFFVSLDTYHDHRTAYTFGVSASGVRIDRYHPRDDEETADTGFDPVWEAKTSIDDQGWTAELWIPFAQLRFSDEDVQAWGLNVGRFTPTLDEDDYWVLVPRTERAWASRFGVLQGIHGVRPSRRIELLEVVVGSSTLNANRDATRSAHASDSETRSGPCERQAAIFS
ncbi:MAG: carbohydrate binding family 9 domain-containing protein [Betaproteobacteria bacterium]